jgi:hypothetical protein
VVAQPVEQLAEEGLGLAGQADHPELHVYRSVQAASVSRDDTA